MNELWVFRGRVAKLGKAIVDSEYGMRPTERQIRAAVPNNDIQTQETFKLRFSKTRALRLIKEFRFTHAPDSEGIVRVEFYFRCQADGIRQDGICEHPYTHPAIAIFIRDLCFTSSTRSTCLSNLDPARFATIPPPLIATAVTAVCIESYYLTCGVISTLFFRFDLA